MKKFSGIKCLLLALIILAGCSDEGKNETTKTTDSKISSAKTIKKEVEGNEELEEQSKLAGEKVLNAVLKRDTYSFKSVGKQKYDYFVTEIIEEFVEKEKKNYEPEEDWTVFSDYSRELTPSDVLENFKRTQIYNIVPEIGDYAITKTKLEDDTAIITFKSKAVANKEIKSILQLIRESADLEGELDGESRKKSDYFNYYLYWLAFEKNSKIIPITEKEQSFKLSLTIEDGDFILSKEQYKELINQFFVETISNDESESGLSEDFEDTEDSNDII